MSSRLRDSSIQMFFKKMLVRLPIVSVLAADLPRLLVSLSQHGLLVTAPHQCNPVFHVSPLSVFSLSQQHYHHHHHHQIISLSLILNYIYMYESFACIYLSICLHHILDWCLRRTEEGVKPLASEIAESCEFPRDTGN